MVSGYHIGLIILLLLMPCWNSFAVAVKSTVLGTVLSVSMACLVALFVHVICWGVEDKLLDYHDVPDNMANILICSIDSFRKESSNFEKLWIFFWMFRDVLRLPSAKG